MAAIRSALLIQSIFLDIAGSTTAERLSRNGSEEVPHSVLELRHAETTTTALQLSNISKKPR
jgi:hypothetical protein